MAEIIVIAAVAKNNAIGRNGEIPWHIKEDFQHFQELTMGNPCVMGEKTYESLPENARPLPGRENIILSFKEDYNPEGTVVFNSWEKAMDYLKDKSKVYICGGASIYKLGLQHADTLELTRIQQEFDADTFFPEIDFSQWELVKSEEGQGINKRDKKMVSFTFETYRRKK